MRCPTAAEDGLKTGHLRLNYRIQGEYPRLEAREDVKLAYRDTYVHSKQHTHGISGRKAQLYSQSVSMRSSILSKTRQLTSRWSGGH